MTDLEYHWDQLEKSVGTLEETMNTLNLELNELRKKKKLLKRHQDIDHLAWAKLGGVELHMREIEKTIQNCELTKSIILNELASKDLPLTSKEAKDGYDPKFNPKDRRLIQENWKNNIAKRFGKRGEKRTTKMEEKLETSDVNKLGVFDAKCIRFLYLSFLKDGSIVTYKKKRSLKTVKHYTP
jgi:hypothetical protein